jgi:hypothetical protein
VAKFLDSAKIPFIILALAMIAIELGASLSRALHASFVPYLVAVNAGFYILSEVSLGIFFFIMAYKVRY